MSFDPIKLEVYQHLLNAICEEMGAALRRSAYSPNIKERRDYSCALFDPGGEMVAQGAHMPVHLGSMPLSVTAALESIKLGSGDVALLNDPFAGGTHLPDLTMVTPVFDGDALLGYLANRAHHADVGGISPGSMALTTEIYQEGIRIPPTRLVRGGKTEEDLLRLILANVRTPEEREGDLRAQLASFAVGAGRMIGLFRRYGQKEVHEYMEELKGYAERLTRRAIASMPDGEYTFRDEMDDDGMGSGPVPIQVRLEVRGETARLDFSGSSPQVRGPVNANRAITLSATFYCFRCLAQIVHGAEIPSNWGIIRPLELITPEGSVVNARPPSAVAGGNVETSQRIVDVVLGALAEALPDRIPAASSGTMNNLTFGGFDPARGRPFAYYETVAGGMGARSGEDGWDGVHTHMTNSLNTPIEALESSYPVRVRRYGLRHGSGGEGRYRGGEGIRREIEFLVPVTVTVLADRRRKGPYGLRGGDPGLPGRTLRVRGGKEEELPGKVSYDAERGEILVIESPGGGGWGTSEGNKS